MKYLKKYQIFESILIDSEKWEDVKDLIQLEILDKWGISNDLVRESIPGKSGDKLLEPELHIRINERMNNDEPVEIVKACRNLHKRIFALVGLFIDVRWSSQQINIMLNDYPNHYTLISDFDLIEIEDDNTYDRETGGVCDFETALKIISYLNSFYRFVYDSDLEIFKKSYKTLDDLYKVELIFSLPKFEKERFRQILCFKFKLESKVEKIIGKQFPILIFNTNHTDSPLIRKRTGNYNWIEIFGEKKVVDFLSTEQF